MKILVLGGTVFVGRAVAAAAIARGHAVTLFNRGLHNPYLFPEAERLRGDRDGDLGALAGRRFDAVVDTNGYLPRVVRGSVQALAGAASVYAFVSTMAVYASFRERGIDEDAPLAALPDPRTEDVATHYGALKAACEAQVQEEFRGRALLVRPGIIVGPHDPTDRFTYWVTRMARGGAVLAPGDGNAPVQVIDVRDLGEWIVSCLEAGRVGAFNATGPEAPISFRQMLDTCHAAASSDASIEWVSDAFLLGHGVTPFVGLPLWLPVPDLAGLFHADVSRARAAGLSYRPLEETAGDTLSWRRAHPDEHSPVGGGVTFPPPGLAPAREEELLRAWRESK
jgi:2'-hydroxyisoflavone reductase